MTSGDAGIPGSASYDRAMRRIEGVVKDYPWGARRAIPQLLGFPETGGPVAEVWYGSHSAGAARLLDAATDGPRTLDELVSADARGVLGQDVVDHFGPRLPYLLKVIAAERPLSLQVHPSLERARERFSAEEAAGLPPERRSYSDANHKPELVHALTPFEALCGFRARRRVLEILDGLDAELAHDLRARLQGAGPGGAMRSAFTHLFDEATRPDAGQIAELVAACAARLTGGSPSPRADRNVVRLHEVFPGDPGVATSLLLNPVTLRPGETMFVPAGAVHSYLAGTAIEIMASSDNVLRAGLTTKHIDVPEMLQCVDYAAAPPIRIAPERYDEHTRIFYAPVDDFELSVTPLATMAQCALPGRGPRILLALGGAVRVRAASGGDDVLEDGRALFVRADDGAVTVERVGAARADGAVVPVLVQADVP